MTRVLSDQLEFRVLKDLEVKLVHQESMVKMELRVQLVLLELMESQVYAVLSVDKDLEVPWEIVVREATQVDPVDQEMTEQPDHQELPVPTETMVLQAQLEILDLREIPDLLAKMELLVPRVLVDQ